MKNEKQDRIFYGTVKVSDKGQIAIPKELREYLGIEKGDQLLIGRRKDNKGLILLKMEVIEETFTIQDDVFSSK